MFGSQDSRTVMTLGKLISSEHQLKLFRRSQETLGKYVVHYCPNIFAYCENAGVLCFISPILFVISRTESVKIFAYFSGLVFAVTIIYCILLTMYVSM